MTEIKADLINLTQSEQKILFNNRFKRVLGVIFGLIVLVSFIISLIDILKINKINQELISQDSSIIILEGNSNSKIKELTINLNLTHQNTLNQISLIQNDLFLVKHNVSVIETKLKEEGDQINLLLDDNSNNTFKLNELERIFLETIINIDNTFKNLNSSIDVTFSELSTFNNSLVLLGDKLNERIVYESNKISAINETLDHLKDLINTNNENIINKMDELDIRLNKTVLDQIESTLSLKNEIHIINNTLNNKINQLNILNQSIEDYGEMIESINMRVDQLNITLILMNSCQVNSFKSLNQTINNQIEVTQNITLRIDQLSDILNSVNLNQIESFTTLNQSIEKQAEMIQNISAKIMEKEEDKRILYRSNCGFEDWGSVPYAANTYYVRPGGCFVDSPFYKIRNGNRMDTSLGNSWRLTCNSSTDMNFETFFFLNALSSTSLLSVWLINAFPPIDRHYFIMRSIDVTAGATSLNLRCEPGFSYHFRLIISNTGNWITYSSMTISVLS